MFAVYAMQRDLCSKRSKVPYVFFIVTYVQSAERFHMFFFFFTTLRKNRHDLYHHPLLKSQPSIVARHMRHAFYHDTTKFSNYNRQSSINRLQNTIHRRVDFFLTMSITVCNLVQCRIKQKQLFNCLQFSISCNRRLCICAEVGRISTGEFTYSNLICIFLAAPKQIVKI